MLLNHRLLTLICAMLFLTACGNGQNNTPEKRSDPHLYTTNKEDRPMNQAMATARQKFPRFDSAFKSGRYDKDKFSIKVRLVCPDGNEYIWLTDISKVGTHYWGVMTDTPRMTNQYKVGDHVKINYADITDWLYGKDSTLHGGYTLRLIYNRLSDKERADQEAGFPYKIED